MYTVSENISGEKRLCYKLTLRSTFKELIVRLHALSDDATAVSDMRCVTVCNRFHVLYGAEVKKLFSEGVSSVVPEYQEEEMGWRAVRNNFAAHTNMSFESFLVQQKTISKFLHELCMLTSKMQRVVTGVRGNGRGCYGVFPFAPNC